MSGIKHDQNKPRWELLPLDAVEEIVKVMTYGAKKYRDGGWKRVRPRSRYYAAAMRHLRAVQTGHKIDPESGLRHVSHFATNALFLVWMELHS